MSYTSSTLNNVTSVTRSEGLTVTWTPPSNSDPDLIFIQISGWAFAPNLPYGAQFACNVPLAAAGLRSLLRCCSHCLQAGLATPQGNSKSTSIVAKPFTAPGADVGTINWVWPTPEVFSYQ